MHMGIGCFQKYSAWSISTTDGLSQGVPYILPNGMCYPEMVGEQYPLLYKANDSQSFKDMIESVLDVKYMRDKANSYLEPKLEGFTAVSCSVNDVSLLGRNHFRLFVSASPFRKC